MTLAGCAALPLSHAVKAQETQQVDHRFAPPWWQTAICLPDDEQKSLVGKEGMLLYDYRAGAEVSHKFQTSIAVELPGKSEWLRQELLSPRVPIVRTCKRNGAVEIIEEAFARGTPREDFILVQLRNTGAVETAAAPAVAIQSGAPMKFDEAQGRVEIGKNTVVSASLKVKACDAQGKRAALLFEPLTLPARGEVHFAVRVRRNSQGAPDPLDLARAEALRRQVQEYWEKLDLPYGVITVPDAGVQALLESSIRNIYQAREIKNGLPAFQVGPTCYRGLWVVDGSFLMEAVALLGRTQEARAGMQYLLSFQQPDGGFELIKGHFKETGIVLWALTRHARLTRDKQWLSEVWPKVERGCAYIQSMREHAAADPKAPNYRLIAPGFSDGGLAGPHLEYTNVYWSLVGVRAAVEAARWLGKTAQAEAWQKEYDDFMATFRRAAERDMADDGHGNRCLPIPMTQRGLTPISGSLEMGCLSLLPPLQKAQWSFLHAVFPGKLFAANDPLVTGNLAMLRAAESEGLVLDTGWMSQGIWAYFGSFYAHAWLWMGDREKAIRTYYAFANHASPLLAWREEQKPVGKGNEEVGDMPHNWASAEFIRLTRHLLILERGEELHLCEGLPAEWVRPNMVTRVQGGSTDFGPVTFELRVNADGSQAHVTLETGVGQAVSLSDRLTACPTKIVLHHSGWSGREGTMELCTGRKTECDVPLRLNYSPQRHRDTEKGF